MKTILIKRKGSTANEGSLMFSFSIPYFLLLSDHITSNFSTRGLRLLNSLFSCLDIYYKFIEKRVCILWEEKRNNICLLSVHRISGTMLHALNLSWLILHWQSSCEVHISILALHKRNSCYRKFEYLVPDHLDRK